MGETRRKRPSAYAGSDWRGRPKLASGFVADSRPSSASSTSPWGVALIAVVTVGSPAALFAKLQDSFF
jgi:hypothetical protein